ncbi:glycosyl transferase [Polaribacter sp. BM10]|uniref:glycosyltransferase family 2 protein n=1 Tax=Polaribacter sp. BM10 TaxID=1529069 RepID=UPI00098A0F41|nr:glycosyltransferase family 2 protein [Polaribacter sp. BM10]AQS93255.1 glycosyl transferase [Polaribacter sp. BM10]
MNNLVSIITPSYNSSAFISKTIISVLNQTYKNWEMIIVDDCSTDGSNKLIESFIAKDSRIMLHKLAKNSGTAIARNTAIDIANGEFIAFLDSDDIWLPNKLELQIEFMIQNNYNFTHTSYSTINETSEKPIKNFICRPTLNYKNMLYSNRIGCLTVIYNANKLGKIYMPNVRKRQDYALWLKILKIEEHAFGIPEILAHYRLRNQSISNNKFEMLKWNFYLFKNIEKMSYVKSFFYLSCNVFNKLF